jgi:ferric-dicitrate binding protein FerR (iron transport regulator)
MNADNSTGSDLPPEVQSWLDEHPEVDADALAKVWCLSGDVPPTMTPDPERVSAMREALVDATAEDRRPQESEEERQRSDALTSRADDRPATGPPRRFRSWRAWTVGATFMALLVAASVYYVASPTRVTAPAGETRLVSLADGSEVTLNSGTTLRYPRWWNLEFLRSQLGRSVQLDGEAFFTVAETGTPFRVETKNAEVRVLGTQFDVRARQADGRLETRVVVAEGHVALKAAGKTTRLDSAQTATVQAAGPPSSVQTARLDRVLAWRRGGLSFTGASVRTVSAELSRRFDVPINVRPEVKGRPVTLHVDNPKRPTALLRDVCRAAGCRVDSTADGLVVRPR